jgi:hypothetical protein
VKSKRYSYWSNSVFEILTVRNIIYCHLDYYYIGIHKKEREKDIYVRKWKTLKSQMILLLLKQRFKEYYNDDV